MTAFITGETGLLTAANKVGPDRQGYFSYEGAQRGEKVTHHIFRNINGGYLITYTDIDFRCGDVTFTKEGVRHTKLLRHRTKPKIKNAGVSPFLARLGCVNFNKAI